MGRFSLSIQFLGLCAFVPNLCENKAMRVLLIDGRAPGLASDGRGHISHLPSLRFNIADLSSNLFQPFFYLTGKKDEMPQGQWVLNGDDLEIRVNGAPLSGNDLRIVREDDYDFSLLPMMSNIYPETAGLAVKEECLTVKDRLSEVGLAARLQLRNGTVSAYPGEDCQYLSAEEYTFTGLTNNYHQRLAACTIFETEIAADQVEIFSYRIGRGFHFRPADGKRVELIISNIPPAGLEAAKPGDADTDIDFELIYKVAGNLPPQLRVPARSLQGPEYPQPLICASAIYNPSEQA